VTGRSQPVAAATMNPMSLVPLALLVVAVVANLQSAELWAAFLVAAAGLWSVDLRSSLESRGKIFAPLAVTAAAAAGTLAAHSLGGTGYGLAVALAVAVCLGWAVAFREYRKVDVFAPTMLVGLLAAVGAASLMLSRSAASPDPQAVDVFLVAVVAGVVAGSVVSRMPAVPFLDPFSATALVAVFSALVAAMVWDLDVVGYLLVGIGVAVALIAGTGLSSMIRTGRVRLTVRPLGLVPSLDGIVLAAAIYYPLIRVIL
jgi:hypothetical protein